MRGKQVHLWMPDDLHRQVEQNADAAGGSLTAYLQTLIEADLQDKPCARSHIDGLALRVRAGLPEHLSPEPFGLRFGCVPRRSSRA